LLEGTGYRGAVTGTQHLLSSAVEFSGHCPGGEKQIRRVIALVKETGEPRNAM